MGNLCQPAGGGDRHLQHPPRKSAGNSYAVSSRAQNDGAAAQSRGENASSRLPPQPPRWLAKYPYNPGFAEALAFKEDEILVQTGTKDRFTYVGHKEGVPGVTGSFPATYVEKYEVLVYPFMTPPPPSARPSKGIVMTRSGGGRKRVQWGAVERLEAFARDEYPRACNFNPQMSQMQWEREEPEEIRRQQLVRWEYMESLLPNGEKCMERLEFELKHERLQLVAQQRIQAKREQDPRAEADRQRKREEFKAARARKRAQEAMQAYDGGLSTPPGGSAVMLRDATPGPGYNAHTFEVGAQAPPTPLGGFEAGEVEVDC